MPKKSEGSGIMLLVFLTKDGELALSEAELKRAGEELARLVTAGGASSLTRSYSLPPPENPARQERLKRVIAARGESRFQMEIGKSRGGVPQQRDPPPRRDDVVFSPKYHP